MNKPPVPKSRVERVKLVLRAINRARQQQVRTQATPKPKPPQAE